MRKFTRKETVSRKSKVLLGETDIMSAEEIDILGLGTPQILSEAVSFLDHYYFEFLNVSIEKDLRPLFSSFLFVLDNMKGLYTDSDWRAFHEIVTDHPIHTLLLEDSLTKRAYEKPRGYAGDAVLMDYFYFGAAPTESLTDFGRALMSLIRESPAGSAVRDRARIISQTIDSLYERRSDLSILSIACGHAREPSNSLAFLNNRVTDFTLLDQDSESLALINDQYSELQLSPKQISVKDLLTKGPQVLENEGFDYIYSAGLFDYLPKRVATKLVSIMFSILKPGGIAHITNYMPNTVFKGYMEAVMDWELIYRNFSELEALSRHIPLNELQSKRLFTEVNNRVAFLALEKVYHPKPYFFFNKSSYFSYTSPEGLCRVD